MSEQPMAPSISALTESVTQFHQVAAQRDVQAADLVTPLSNAAVALREVIEQVERGRTPTKADLSGGIPEIFEEYAGALDDTTEIEIIPWEGLHTIRIGQHKVILDGDNVTVERNNAAG